MGSNRPELLWQATRLDCSVLIVHWDLPAANGRDAAGALDAAGWGAPNRVCATFAEGEKKWMLRGNSHLLRLQSSSPSGPPVTAGHPASSSLEDSILPPGQATSYLPSPKATRLHWARPCIRTIFWRDTQPPTQFLRISFLAQSATAPFGVIHFDTTLYKYDWHVLCQVIT
jgi:hypothetical protein